MANHTHGEMDTTAQEQTYAGFVTFVIRSVVLILVTLVLLTLLNA